MVFSLDVWYDEYYASYHDLDLFLQGVPIFEDFDSEQDKTKLQAYVARFQTDKGIRLPRHRFLVAAMKPSPNEQQGRSGLTRQGEPQ